MKREVEITTYLVLAKRTRGYPKVRVTRCTDRQPALNPGERALRISIRVDEKFFEPAGVPTAVISIPEHMLSEPVPDVEVLPYNEEEKS